MAVQRLNLTRDQLASFLQDFEQIKQFEKLFSTVDTINTVTLDEISVSAGNAMASATEALATIEVVKSILEYLELAPAAATQEQIAALQDKIFELELVPMAATQEQIAALQDKIAELEQLPSLGNVTSSSLGTFTAGSVIFAGASGELTQNNADFFWDNTSTFLGIGTNLPVAKLQVTYDGPAIKTNGADSTNISPDVQITRFSSGTAIQSGPNITFSDGTDNNTIAIQNSQGNLGFWNYGSATWLERVRIGALGSVGIGTSTLTAKLNISTDGPAIKTDGASSANVVADVQLTRSSSGTAIQSGPNITFSDGTANNTVAIQNSQGNLGFWNFGSATWLERMRIDSSGNVGIGATANASALLDVQSTTKGVRMPNMTTTQKNAITSPAAGLMVFDTTLSKLCVYSGAAWQTVTSV